MRRERAVPAAGAITEWRARAHADRIATADAAIDQVTVSAWPSVLTRLNRVIGSMGQAG